MNPLAQMVLDQARAMYHNFALGLKAGKEINKTAHAALKVAYERAQNDEKAVLPTALSCAIENVLRLREEQEINDYANAAIKRDQLARHEGKPEHDMCPRSGGVLRPGS